MKRVGFDSATFGSLFKKVFEIKKIHDWDHFLSFLSLASLKVESLVVANAQYSFLSVCNVDWAQISKKKNSATKNASL